jgi:UDP-2,4-diacetamido-2,4,6-trideoxy-beta-L-altropyranose hydrolase
MKVVFRADASLEIGTGHVMRCLTLAEAIRQHGGWCSFVCKDHEGNLVELISQRGFAVHRLPIVGAGKPLTDVQPGETNVYGDWLGGDWSDDARQTCALIEEEKADWVVVDHYAVDYRWGKEVRASCRRLMVIDDLADRRHDCDLLLDQNLGREAGTYRGLVPLGARTLLGPHYALLRPEFAHWRERSLARRVAPQLKQLLVTLGGVDQNNITGQVLDALNATDLPQDLRITVVLGANAPWLSQVQAQGTGMSRPTQVLVGVNNMAQLMAESDLAIGAAGSTSWERCCLGLPSLLLVLADNQQPSAVALHGAGAAILLPGSDHIAEQIRVLLSDGAATRMLGMIHAAAAVTDGQGASRLIDTMTSDHA